MPAALTATFNLSILECKFRVRCGCARRGGLLISPYWNVNANNDAPKAAVKATFNLSILECKLRLAGCRSRAPRAF